MATQGLAGSRRIAASVNCWPGPSASSQDQYISISNADFAVAPRGITLTPEGAAAGQPVTPQVIVNNLGSGDGTTSVRIYRGYPEQGDLASSGTISVIAGSSAVFTGASFTPPVEAPYVLTVMLDQENAVTESNETNNTAERSTLKKPGDVIVAFDEMHAPGSSIADARVLPLGGVPGGLSEFAQDLLARGYVVKALTPELERLSPENLRGVDVLLAVVPMAAYASSELSLIHSFVEGGGGFFYLGDRRDYGGYVPLWSRPGDQLLGTFGVTANNDYVIPGNYTCVAFGLTFTKSEGVVRPHVITTGVDAVTIYWAGSYSGLPADSEILIKTPPTWLVPNAVVSAVFPVGNGRVAIHGDSNVADADWSGPSPCGMVAMYFSANNKRFALQTVDWLAKGALGDWKPDLSFEPHQLVVSQSVVNSGDRVQVKAVVRNVGGTLAAAGEAVVRLYDGAPASGAVLGEQRVPDLTAGQEYEVAFDWDTTSATGWHTLTAVVDPDNLVDEFAEDNNSVMVTLEVRRRVDLRVDPSDIVVAPGAPPVVTVRVHNLGFVDAPAGGRARLSIGPPESSLALVTIPLPTVPARGAVSVTAPFPGPFPAVAFDLFARTELPAGVVDADPKNDEASMRFEPPEVTIHSPVTADRWGGAKTVRWSASGTRRPNLTTALSIAPSGGAHTGLPATTSGSFTLETTGYPDGDYVIRVAASDGLQTTTQDVPVRLENVGLSIRAFSGGVASVAFAETGGTARVPVPVGSRVTTASLLLDPVPSSGATVGSSYVGMGNPRLVEHRGIIHALYRLLTGGVYSLYDQSSRDGGATWSAPLRVSPPGVPVFAASAAVNSHGVHVVYGVDWNQQFNAGDYVAYTRSEDGTAWSDPHVLATTQPSTFELSANESGIVFSGPGPTSTITPDLARWNGGIFGIGSPDGATWSVGVVPSFTATRLWAFGGGDRIRVLLDRTSEGVFYTEASAAAFADPNAYAPLANVSGGLSSPNVQGAWSDDSATGLVYRASGGLYAQRCPRAWNCTLPDSWSPELIRLAANSVFDNFHAFATGGIDSSYLHWCSGNRLLVRGFGSGSWWTAQSGWGSKTGCGGIASSFLADGSSVAMLENGGTMYAPTTVYAQLPELTPADLQVDVNGDGAPELALTGMIARPVRAADLAAAMNAYLASHTDADDGTIDGYVSVPVVVSSRGTGGTTLRNLEVRYQPASAVAAFAEPALFSPSSSPGLLDSCTLSIAAAGPIVVNDQLGAQRRTLATTAAGGRSVAVFDGRDGTGNVLPSGAYRFGAASAVVGDVEIDDLPPIVELRASTEGNHGGVAPVYGRATDADFAGTSKNFARYVLEFSSDGVAWTRIASATTPVDGLLGAWDTRGVTAGPSTLRLTAYDRAGNSTTTSRVVGVSPNAPLAPAIDTPTIAGRPVDSLSATIAVAGVAEPGTVVTVWVNGTPTSSSASDGRWTAGGIVLPPGFSSITASASRNGIESPRSQEIVVARYALTVAMDVPATAPAGSTVSGTITVLRTSVSGEPVTIRLSTLDSTGAIANVALTPAEQVLALPASGSATLALQLGGAGVRSGTYTVAADVAGGRVPASTQQAVTFTPVQELVATLYSDKALYGSDQVVGLAARAANTGASPTGELHASITVVAPSGTVTVLGPYAISSIPAGTSKDLGALFGTPPLELGVHLADLRVTDEWGGVVATADTSFEVRAGAGTALVGGLVVNPSTYSIGQPLQADWAITNPGGSATVTVSLLLMRAADGLVFTRHDEQVVIPAGMTVTGSTALSTTGTDGDEIVAILLGNGRGLAAQAVAPNLVPDTTPPVITFVGFMDGECATSVTPIVVVSDESPFTSELTLDGTAFVNGTPVVLDGDYVVSVHAVDVWGNEARAERRFTVDRIAPTIALTGVEDGALVNTAVLPVVNVTDLHLSMQTVTLDGGPWNGMPVTSDGDHVLDVHAEDRAGNRSDVRVGFSVDTVPPALSITNVVEGGLYREAVEPLVTVVELHPGTPAWTATLNGAPWIGGVVSADGDWTLVTDATDAAGNAAPSAQVDFTVDMTAPVIHVSGVTDGLLTRSAVTPIVTIDELHPGTSAVTLDGAAFVSGTAVMAEGPHVLSVTAMDAAGNPAIPVTIRFTRDSTPPVITIGGVSEGESYYVDATPTFSVSDLNPGTVTATLDGAPFASGATVAVGGLHLLQVSAIDLAGNTSTQSVSFRVVAVQAAVAATVDVDPRVIVVVNCSGQPASCADTQARVLFASLAGAGIPYEVALDGTTFLQKVRENRHTVRILYRSGSSATNSYGELRELTFGGGGLITVNDASPDSDPKLKQTIGVSMGGSIKTVGTLTISAGDLGPARSLTVAGSGIAQTLPVSTVTLVGTCTKGTVVSTNRYGGGRAVTLTLNPEANDNAGMRDLLVQIVRFAGGGTVGNLHEALPGVPQYVKFASTLTAPTGPLDMQLDAWTGTGLLPLSDAGTPTTSPSTWTFPLSAGAPVTRSLAVTATQPGAYPVLGELTLRAGTVPRLVSQASVDVVITLSVADLKAQAIAATNVLPPSSAKTTVLSHLTAVDPNPATKAACDAAISHTVAATDSLIAIGTAATDARAKTDRLLRSLQALYLTLP